MIKRVFFFLLFLCSCAAFAQDNEEEDLITLPDTFTFFQGEVSFVQHLDSLHGKIFDSIENPKAYFIDTYHSGSGYEWKIAIAQKEGYSVFAPFENSYAYTDAGSVNFERVNFNGKGSDELIIHWDFRTGHSSWQGGVYEGSSGKQIWDLDNIVRYLDLQTAMSLEIWWTTYEEDTTELKPYEELKVLDSGGEFDCFQYEVIIEKKKISIQEIDCEADDETEEISPSSAETKRYKFTKKGLVLQPQNH